MSGADGESVLVAHNNEEFAMQIVSLLYDPIKRTRLGTSARQVALATVDWRVLGERLVQLVERTR